MCEINAKSLGTSTNTADWLGERIADVVRRKISSVNNRSKEYDSIAVKSV